MGGRGHPPRLFASGLSLEKAWIPARDRAGTHLAGSTLRRSQREPTDQEPPHFSSVTTTFTVPVISYPSLHLSW